MQYPPVILEVIYKYLFQYELAVIAPKYCTMSRARAFECAAASDWISGMNELYDYIERGLVSAAIHGSNVATMQLLVWGAGNISEAYTAAAAYNQTDIMQILALFGPINLKAAMINAAIKNSILAVILIKKEYCHPRILLDIAISIDSIALHALAMEWGAQPAKSTLQIAIRYNSDFYYRFQPAIPMLRTVLESIIQYGRHTMFRHYLSVYPALTDLAADYCISYGQLLMLRIISQHTGGSNVLRSGET